MLPQLHIKSTLFSVPRHSYSNVAGVCREVVIDFELLRVRQNETFVKERCVASANFSETFRFKSPHSGGSWLI